MVAALTMPFLFPQGKENDTDEGTLLGTFTYDENGEPTQTFQLPVSSNQQLYNILKTARYSQKEHDQASWPKPCKGLDHVWSVYEIEALGIRMH